MILMGFKDTPQVRYGTDGEKEAKITVALLQLIPETDEEAEDKNLTYTDLVLDTMDTAPDNELWETEGCQIEIPLINAVQWRQFNLGGVDEPELCTGALMTFNVIKTGR